MLASVRFETSDFKFQISICLVPGIEHRRHSISNLLDSHRLHTAKINRTLPKEAGAAFDMMSQYDVIVAKRASQARLGRTKNGDDRYPQQCGEMHGAGIVREQQTALTQFVDKFIERGLSDTVHATVPDCRRDLLTDCCVVFCAKQNP